MATLTSRHLSVRIEKPYAEVYAFLEDPANMQKWAAGLSGGLEQKGDHWVGHDPNRRPIEVRFTPKNDYGVLDHTVKLPDGAEVVNPMRVIRNGDGAEVIFTFHRQPWMSEADGENDTKMVEKDLAKLKTLLES